MQKWKRAQTSKTTTKPGFGLDLTRAVSPKSSCPTVKLRSCHVARLATRVRRDVFASATSGNSGVGEKPSGHSRVQRAMARGMRALPRLSKRLSDRAQSRLPIVKFGTMMGKDRIERISTINLPFRSQSNRL
jgi:hypothetical protein